MAVLSLLIHLLLTTIITDIECLSFRSRDKKKITHPPRSQRKEASFPLPIYPPYIIHRYKYKKEKTYVESPRIDSSYQASDSRPYITLFSRPSSGNDGGKTEEKEKKQKRSRRFFFRAAHLLLLPSSSGSIGTIRNTTSSFLSSVGDR